MVIANRLLIASAKGGVGKTSVAVHLALELAARGFRVGLMDTDIHNPAVAKLLKIEKSQVKLGDFIEPVEVEGVKVMSIGLFAPEEVAIMWKSERERDAIANIVYNVNWGDLDYLICDSSPTQGDEFEATCAMVQPNGVIIVVTPQELDSIAIKSVSAAKILSIPIIGLVENKAGYACPQCGHVEFNGESDVAKRTGLPVIDRIPLDPRHPEQIKKVSVNIANFVAQWYRENAESLGIIAAAKAETSTAEPPMARTEITTSTPQMEPQSVTMPSGDLGRSRDDFRAAMPNESPVPEKPVEKLPEEPAPAPTEPSAKPKSKAGKKKGSGE